MKTFIATCLLLSACSTEENLGASSRGAYTTLAKTKVQGTYELTADATYVYWSVEDDNDTPLGSKWTLFRVPKAGGSVEEVGPVADHFTLGDDYVYTHRPDRADLVRLPKTGGPTEHLIDVPEEVTDVVAIDDTSVYLVDDTTRDSDVTRSTLWRVPKAGGSREDILMGLPFLSHFNVTPRGLSWIGSNGDLWTKSQTGDPTRVIPTIGSDVATQRCASILITDADSMFVFTSPPATSQGEDLSTELTKYNLADGTTTSLGSYDGVTDRAVVSANGVVAIDVDVDFSIPQPPTPTAAVVVYPPDGTGRQVIWGAPSLDTFDAVHLDADGSAVFWIDPTTGNVNRSDFDLTSTVQ